MYKLAESSRIQNIEDRFKCSIKKALYNWHWKDNLKHSEIGEKISIPRSTITKWFKYFNVPTQSCTRFTKLNLLNVGLRKTPPARPKIKKERPWKVNEGFFKKWTPEMAYVLGFFTADGSMTKNRRGAHFIEFQITDKDLLEKIKKVIGSNHKISIRNRRNNRWKDIYRLQIGSKEMFNDLLGLGLTPNKSKTIKLPDVLCKYFSHFVRGYFDGDGHVSITTYKRKDRNNKITTVLLSGFTSGSKKILKSLHIKLKKFANISGGTLYYNNRGYRLCFSVKDSLKLYDFMYVKLKDNLFLNRKKKIFENYFKIS